MAHKSAIGLLSAGASTASTPSTRAAPPGHPAPNRSSKTVTHSISHLCVPPNVRVLRVWLGVLTRSLTATVRSLPPLATPSAAATVAEKPWLFSDPVALAGLWFIQVRVSVCKVLSCGGTCASAFTHAPCARGSWLCVALFLIAENNAFQYPRSCPSLVYA